MEMASSMAMQTACLRHRPEPGMESSATASPVLRTHGSLACLPAAEDGPVLPDGTAYNILPRDMLKRYMGGQYARPDPAKLPYVSNAVPPNTTLAAAKLFPHATNQWWTPATQKQGGTPIAAAPFIFRVTPGGLQLVGPQVPILAATPASGGSPPPSAVSNVFDEGRMLTLTACSAGGLAQRALESKDDLGATFRWAGCTALHCPWHVPWRSCA